MSDNIQPCKPRVVLRQVALGDLPALYEQQLDDKANQMAAVKPRDLEAFNVHWARILANRSVVARAIVADGALVGHISCFRMNAQDNVGYWLGKEYWGKGIATRALALLLKEVSTRPLHARAARHNVGSIRVLERCGFRIVSYTWSPADERLVACEEALLMLK